MVLIRCNKWNGHPLEYTLFGLTDIVPYYAGTATQSEVLDFASVSCHRSNDWGGCNCGGRRRRRTKLVLAGPQTTPGTKRRFLDGQARNHRCRRHWSWNRSWNRGGNSDNLRCKTDVNWGGRRSHGDGSRSHWSHGSTSHRDGCRSHRHWSRSYIDRRRRRRNVWHWGRHVDVDQYYARSLLRVIAKVFSSENTTVQRTTRDQPGGINTASPVASKSTGTIHVRVTIPLAGPKRSPQIFPSKHQRA